MKQWTPPNWGATLPPVAAVPAAFSVGLLLADGFRCGAGHAALGLFLALYFAWLPIVGAILVIVLIATIPIELWFRTVPLRRWRISCAVLALAAAVTGASIILFNPDPTFCRIDL